MAKLGMVYMEDALDGMDMLGKFYVEAMEELGVTKPVVEAIENRVTAKLTEYAIQEDSK